MSARIEVSLWLINQKNLNAQAPRFWILSCFQIFFAALLLLGVRSEDSSTRRYRVQSWLPYCTHRSLCFRWKGSGRSAKAQSNLSSWKFRYTDDTHLMVSFDLSEISRSFSFPSLPFCLSIYDPEVYGVITCGPTLHSPRDQSTPFFPMIYICFERWRQVFTASATGLLFLILGKDHYSLQRITATSVVDRRWTWSEWLTLYFRLLRLLNT